MEKVLEAFRCPQASSRVSVVGIGPQKAALALGAALANDAEANEWLASASKRSLLGSCPRSLPSVKSGITAFHAFCVRALHMRGEWLPPSTATLVAWSELFRSADTYRNYLGYVRFACVLMDLPTEAFGSQCIQRAKAAIRKRGNFVPRRKLFLRRHTVAKLLGLVPQGKLPAEYAMLYLFTYVFLLRLPSEALPCTVGGAAFESDSQTLVWLGGDELHLRLQRRKNMPEGSQISRRCWCKSDCATCPVHVLGKFFAELPPGSQPFDRITPALALRALKAALALLPDTRKDASLYRCHVFRRGHAQDLAASGATLVEILLAGQWRSPAFLDYIDRKMLERDAVLSAWVGESSGGEQEEPSWEPPRRVPLCPPATRSEQFDGLCAEPSPLGFGESDEET